MLWTAACTALAGLLLLLCARCAALLLVKRGLSGGSSSSSKRSSIKTMIVLGSGGHTAEMLMLVAGLDKAYYRPRVYVVAETDRMSGSRALSREAEWQQQQQQPAAEAGSAKAAAGRAPPAGGDRSSSSNSSQGGSATVVEVIPRSREVGQSYATSVFTTLYSLLWAAWMVTRHRPQLVLVNGPGTCIPVCAAAFANRLLLGADCRIVYVESIARVRKLSLSGAILYHSRLADAFFVQWAELQARLPRSMYAGRLY